MQFLKSGVLKFLYLLILCCFATTEARSQLYGPQFALRTDLIPASPNAAALGKYGNVPVSMQTGNPSISIPLAEISGNQLKLPVTLNYNNSGFKPVEAASWVGLGWSVNAGGVITRIVRDKVDETVQSQYNYDHTSWRYTTHDSITQKFLSQAMFDLTVDTEPDVYSYNFAGYSGKFFVKNGIFHQYPYNQLVIAYYNHTDNSNGFVITTPDGTKYSFLVGEHTINPGNANAHPDPQNPSYNLPNDYVSSWYLQYVNSADYKDQIILNYSTPVQITSQSPATQLLTRKYQGLSVPFDSLGKVNYPYPTRINVIQLASITSSKMTVVFNAGTLRQDVPTNRLDSIDVKDYQGRLINRVKFNFGYYSTSTDNSPITQRLKLTGIEEGITPALRKKHKFYYNYKSPVDTIISTSNKLPAIDHWGYSNGDDIPDTKSLLPDSLTSTGMPKTPNITYAQRGVLNRIVYPTGGSTVFEYEQNLYNNGFHYIYNNVNQQFSAFRGDTTTSNVINVSYTLNINVAQMVHLFHSRTPKAIYGYPNGTGPDDPTKTDTDVMIKSGSQKYAFFIKYNRNNGGQADSVYLTPGTYTMIVRCDAVENSVDGVIKYVYNTGQVQEGLPGPGLRIKRISNFLNSAGVGTPSSVREYVYKDSTGISTGVLMNIPRYSTGDDYIEHVNKGLSITTTNYRSYTANSIGGNYTTQDMYYKKVYEKQVSGNDYLLSCNEFNGFGGTGGEEFFTTELIRKTDYKKAGSIYQPVAKSEYNYSAVETDDSLYIAIKPYLYSRWIPGGCGLACAVPADSLHVYKYSIYTHTPIFIRLNNERHVSYVNTSDSIVTTSNYAYDKPVYNKIITSTTDSKGTTRVEKVKYPENYSIGTSAPGLGVPIERQMWLKRSATDSVLTDAMIIQYNLAKPVALYEFINPGIVTSLNQETRDSQGLYNTLLSDSRYTQRLTNTYDANNNMIAQDIPGYFATDVISHQVAYLWGYHNNYPIAQVKYADLTAVAYTSFEDDDATWMYTAGSVVTTDARTGTKCYNGTMSKSGLPTGTYTLTLWGKGSGTITIAGTAKTMTNTWTLYQWTITGTSVSINTNGNLIDEVRLLPANAQMTTYTYLPATGVSSITDTKNMTSYFEYDEHQRLANARDQFGNIVKNYDYNYASTAANWQNVIPVQTQCVQFAGKNTGEQQILQVDNNAYSATYQQTRWVSNGTNTTACPLPPTIYVKAVVGSTSVSNGVTYNTFVLRTYSDSNCTVLYNIPQSMSINYSYTTSQYFYDGRANNPSVVTTTGTLTMAGNQNQVTTGLIPVSGCYGVGTKQICYTPSTVFTVQSGDGYVPYAPEM